MYWRHVGIIFCMKMIAGCASAATDINSDNNTNHGVDADDPVYNDPVAYKVYLKGVDPDRFNRCRKEVPTGSHLERIVCGPKRDDRDLIPLLSSPPR